MQRRVVWIGMPVTMILPLPGIITFAGMPGNFMIVMEIVSPNLTVIRNAVV